MNEIKNLEERGFSNVIIFAHLLVRNVLDRKCVKYLAGEPDEEGAISNKYSTPSCYKYGDYQVFFDPWKNGTICLIMKIIGDNKETLYVKKRSL